MAKRREVKAHLYGLDVEYKLRNYVTKHVNKEYAKLHLFLAKCMDSQIPVEIIFKAIDNINNEYPGSSLAMLEREIRSLFNQQEIF